MTYFQSIASTHISCLNFAQRAFFLVDQGRTMDMANLMQEHQVPARAYSDALTQIVLGCGLGGMPLPDERVEKMRSNLTALDLENGNKRRGIKILAKSLTSNMIAQGYSVNDIIAIATEILSIASNELQKRRKK